MRPHDFVGSGSFLAGPSLKYGPCVRALVTGNCSDSVPGSLGSSRARVQAHGHLLDEERGSCSLNRPFGAKSKRRGFLPLLFVVAETRH